MNLGLLDSGCSHNVCGDVWLDIFLDSIPETQKMKIGALEKSNRVFRFGDGKLVTSRGSLRIPVYLGEWTTIKADVIDSDLPLLLSRKWMESVDTSINFKEKKVMMNGMRQRVETTCNGHLGIPLTKDYISRDENVKTENVLFTDRIENKTPEEILRIAKKLHVQFAHPRSERLIRLLKDGGVVDKRLNKRVRDVEEACEICQTHKRVKPDPIVSFPRAQRFNQSVAIDLKQFGKRYMLHLIDEFTRLSRTIVINSKETDIVVDGIIKAWISLYGCADQFLADNGGEFDSEVFRTGCDKFNIEVKSTAAGAPYSNGVNERHNAVLGNTVEKLLEDGHSLENAVCWATSAKNTLASVHGYSPNQLVFGRNPNLPNILDNKLPALETWDKSGIVYENLKAMQKCREEFIKSDADERLKRAMRRQTRTHEPAKAYQLGDKVFFRKNGEWAGPGAVHGVDEKDLWIKQGSQRYRRHPSDIKKVKELQIEEPRQETREKEPLQDNGRQRRHPEAVNRATPLGETCQFELRREQLDEPPFQQCLDKSSSNNDVITYEVEEPVKETERPVVEPETEEEEDGFQDGSVMPKVKQYVEVKDDTGTRNMKIVGRGGKVGGRNQSYLKIVEDDSYEIKDLDWRTVTRWRPIEDQILITYDKEDPEILRAQVAELEKWKEYQVYEEVEFDKSVHPITCQWVVTQKYDGNERKVKARLVARGFQEKEAEKIRKDSPCTSRESVRILLCIAVSKEWRINTIDIKSAFLQGGQLERSVYLKPPKIANSTKMWLLHKCVYGLKDASRLWYIRLNDVLLECGMQKMSLDEGVYVWRSGGAVRGMIVLHVDDIMYCGDSSFKEKIIGKLKETFSISAEAEQSFKYLGLQMKQPDRGGIVVDQSHYVKSLEEAEIDCSPRRKRDERLSEEERRVLKGFAGQLAWAANLSHPEICYAVRMASQNLETSTVGDVLTANKILRRLQNNMHQNISFVGLKDLRTCKIVVYCDASHSKKDDNVSQEGHVIFLVDQWGNANVLRWCSKKVSRVVKSTIAAECLALLNAVETGYYLKKLIEDIMGFDNDLKVVCFCDNKSIVDNLHSTHIVSDFRLRIDVAVVKDMICRKELNKVMWIETKNQLADCFTKLQPGNNLLEVLRTNRLMIKTE